jgi:hypothetical protein
MLFSAWRPVEVEGRTAGGSEDPPLQKLVRRRYLGVLLVWM